MAMGVKMNISEMTIEELLIFTRDWEKEPDFYIKTCEICGNKFEAAYPKAKYCSDECRKINNNRRQKKLLDEEKGS